MNIDVKFLPEALASESSLAQKNCIVLDVFRASSTIITALQNGCLQIKPTLEIEQAWNEKRVHNNWLMAGERMSIKIEGFDFGNSPLEFTPKNIKGKSLIMNTSNGTKAILACQNANKVLIGAFINAKSVIKLAIADGKDIIVVCAGTNGEFSLEDSLCAGYLVSLVNESCLAELTDTAYAALLMYEHSVDKLHKHAGRSKNGARLYEIGLLADVDYCLDINTSKVVAGYDPKSGLICKL